jgi:rare lipoprotein A
MNAEVQIAGSPDGGPVPQAAPRPSVTVEGAPLPPASPLPRTVAAPTTLAGSTTPDGRFMPAPVVAQEAPPANPGRIYIQAGAFTNYDNAGRLRAKLNSIAPTAVSDVTVNGQHFYRVRLGPFDQVDRADQVLAQVLQVGTAEARILID